MKELSIEQKARAYNEALEKSKRLYEQGTITESLAYIFPELKESEDEKIKKALLEMVHDTTGDELWVDYNVHKEDALAWLKKQGEQKPTFEMKTPEESLGIDSETYNKIVDECIYGKQKHDDKVETKFKVGDWITDDEDEAIFHITSYDIDYGYQLETVNGTSFHYSDETIEKKYRLWTIQDAKDGDVLYCDNGNNKTIYLFKEQRGLSNIANTHFQVLNMNNELRLMFNKAADFNLNTKPATKEQRDLLFKKMKEAGYKWDAEKKELRKIEQKSDWSEEDKRMCQETIDWFEKKCFPYALESENPARESIKWLKSLKERIGE